MCTELSYWGTVSNLKATLLPSHFTGMLREGNLEDTRESRVCGSHTAFSQFIFMA